MNFITGRSFGANVAQPPQFFIFGPQESNPTVGAQISAPDSSIIFLFVIVRGRCVVWPYGRYSAVVRGRPAGYFYHTIIGSTRTGVSCVCLESYPTSYCKPALLGPCTIIATGIIVARYLQCNYTISGAARGRRTSLWSSACSPNRGRTASAALGSVWSMPMVFWPVEWPHTLQWVLPHVGTERVGAIRAGNIGHNTPAFPLGTSCWASL